MKDADEYYYYWDRTKRRRQLSCKVCYCEKYKYRSRKVRARDREFTKMFIIPEGHINCIGSYIDKLIKFKEEKNTSGVRHCVKLLRARGVTFLWDKKWKTLIR